MSSGNSTAGTEVSGITTDTQSTLAGQGRGAGRRRDRGGGRSNAGRGAGRPRSTGLNGTTSEMHGNVFECYDEQADRRQFSKTVEALESHVKKTLKYSEDLTPLFASES